MNLELEPFFDQSVDCLCIADYEGYFVKINPAFKKLLGYSDEELHSRLISEFIYHEDKERTAAHREKLLNNVPLVNFENRYVSKSGELVWLHWTSIPLRNERLVYAIAKDVTHNKKLENERISHLNQLSEVNEKLKQQNYTTSHDLRSPLNNLMSLVNLIDLAKIDDEETREIFSLIQLSAEGLKNSLNAFIDSYKQNDIQTEDLKEVGFAEVLQKVQNSISALIQKARAQFQIDFSKMESVEFRSNFMESIFLNLITNSIKYAKPGVPPIISITTHQTNNEKTLTYSDNGLGVDMDKVGHLIFKLNGRFHGNDDSKGVGLYLVHNHVTSLGGSIKVESEVNKGTTFTIKFKG